MSIRMSVFCDRDDCGGWFHTDDNSPRGARLLAGDYGWQRVHVKAGPGSPAHWVDECPDHKSGAEEQAGGRRG